MIDFKKLKEHKDEFQGKTIVEYIEYSVGLDHALRITPTEILYVHYGYSAEGEKEYLEKYKKGESVTMDEIVEKLTQDGIIKEDN